MLDLKRVAITGSLASGKTTVCQFFGQWGAYVVSADHLLHRVFSADTSIGRRICALFEENVLEGRVINRARIAEIVASDPKLLTKVEEICHPYVNREIQRQYRKASREGIHRLFVAEVPLLFESQFPLWQWFNVIIAVVASRKHAKERYVHCGGMKEQFDFRDARQMSPLKKMQQADFTIVNDGTIEELKKEAKKLFDSLITKNP